MSNNAPTESNGAPKKSKTKFIVALLIIIIAILAVIIYLILRPHKDTRPTLITQSNVESIDASLKEPVKDGYYQVTMNTKWNFTDGTSKDAYVENSKDNSHTVYFDLKLSSTGEQIYSSPYITVGQKMTGFKLDKDVAAGTHDAIVTYHLVDEANKEVSSVSVSVSLTAN